MIQSQVLQGFQFRISALYRQPGRQELVEDEVYQVASGRCQVAGSK